MVGRKASWEGTGKVVGGSGKGYSVGQAEVKVKAE